MRLNDLHPAPGAKRPRRRVGRGIAAGRGKTCGRGHKGQKSRAGRGAGAGYEGGQMPLQRRLPKFGFVSRRSRFAGEVRLDQIAGLDAETVDLAVLKAAGLVGKRARRVKVIASGTLTRAVVLRGLIPTRGARAAIEAAGGRVEEHSAGTGSNPHGT